MWLCGRCTSTAMSDGNSSLRVDPLSVGRWNSSSFYVVRVESYLLLCWLRFFAVTWGTVRWLNGCKGSTTNRVGVPAMDGSGCVLSASTYFRAWWFCFAQWDVLCTRKGWGLFDCAFWCTAGSIFDSCSCRGSWCDASCVSRCNRTALFSIICAHIGTSFGKAEVIFKLGWAQTGARCVTALRM